MKKKTKDTIETVEETKETEQVVENTQQEGLMYINKEKRDESVSMEEAIEAGRAELFKTYKSTSRRNNILIVIVAVVFIVGFIIIPNSMIGAVIGWILIGATVIGMIIYYIFTRKLYPTKSKNYIHIFWQETNDFLFDQPGFTDCYIDPKEVYKTVEVAAERAYTGVIDSASRNLVHGKYFGKGFTFGELALYKAGQKKRSRDILFIGRHIDFSNDLHFEGRYIITIKGDKNLDLANDIGDLKALYEQGNVVIYGNEGAKYEKDIGKKTISELKNFAIKDPLLNINVVFWAGRTCVYMSYDDSIVAIPLEQKFSKEAYDSLKKNIKDIFAILLGE